MGKLPNVEHLILDDYSFYKDIQSNPDLFSKWFPKVKDCGIAVPRTKIFQVPEEVFHSFFFEREGDSERVAAWVKDKVFPELSDFPYMIFVKNGVFSDKFVFKNCCIRKNYYELVSSVCSINYDSLTLDTDGEVELVIREYIPVEDEFSYRIYEGMPLRPEFRVFYDYDRKKVLYSVNYWDYDYCYESIARNKTDGLVYEHAFPALNYFFQTHQKEVEDLVEKHMQCIENMQGIWSVDIMWATGQFWLIDMARGFRSAYWDAEKVKFLLEEKYYV